MVQNVPIELFIHLSFVKGSDCHNHLAAIRRLFASDKHSVQAPWFAGLIYQVVVEDGRRQVGFDPTSSEFMRRHQELPAQ